MSHSFFFKTILLISAISCSPLSYADTISPVGTTVTSSTQMIADTAITAKVKSAFIHEKVFGDKDIALLAVKVVTINGIVYLTGKVSTETQAHNAIKIAQATSGVKKVIFKFKVRPII